MLTFDPRRDLSPLTVFSTSLKNTCMLYILRDQNDSSLTGSFSGYLMRMLYVRLGSVSKSSLFQVPPQKRPNENFDANWGVRGLSYTQKLQYQKALSHRLYSPPLTLAGLCPWSHRGTSYPKPWIPPVSKTCGRPWLSQSRREAWWRSRQTLILPLEVAPTTSAQRARKLGILSCVSVVWSPRCCPLTIQNVYVTSQCASIFLP